MTWRHIGYKTKATAAASGCEEAASFVCVILRCKVPIDER